MGKVLRLRYARAEELEPYLNMVAAPGEVYVQFWFGGVVRGGGKGGGDTRGTEGLLVSLQGFLIGWGVRYDPIC